MTPRFRCRILAAGLAFLCWSGALRAAEEHPLSPDSQPQPGVPKGSVQEFTFSHSRIFPGTTRRYWVYVPAQYDPAKPACVYVNQDGIQFNAPVVFDNLIHQNQMPVTVGVFVTPGVVKAISTNALDRFNRSFEYDGLGPNYARFLLEELLTEVETKTTPDGRRIRLSQKGDDRAIGGSSSGAICAFTAAWERPDAFSRVFSAIGTYVGLRGGHAYSTLVRKYEPKPIRVFLQDGSADLNIYAGDWWMANQAMERALVFAGYEVEHVWGTGGHNNQHGSAVFPDAMRWLWKDWPQPVKAGASKNAFLNEILLPGEDWVAVGEACQFVGNITSNPKGEVFYSDSPRGRTWRTASDAAGTLSSWDSNHAEVHAVGPDGRLRALAVNESKVLACDSSGSAVTIAENIRGSHLVVRHDGSAFVTDAVSEGSPASQVWLLKPQGDKQLVDRCLGAATGIALSPDQSLLYVADARSQWIYSYQIASDGALQHKQPFFYLHLPDSGGGSGAGGMCCDRDGRLYVATRLGIQVCDQAGRAECIIPTPNHQVFGLTFGGPDQGTLFAACGDQVFKRKTRVKGVWSGEAPIKPAAPRL